jgi:hypothetical protein
MTQYKEAHMTPSISLYNVKFQNFQGNHDIYVILYSEDVSTNSKHAIYFIHHPNGKWEHEVYEPNKEFLLQRLLEYCNEDDCVDSWAEYALRGLSLALLKNKYGYYKFLDKSFKLEIVEHDLINNEYKNFILGYLRDNLIQNTSTLERFRKMYDVFEIL